MVQHSITATIVNTKNVNFYFKARASQNGLVNKLDASSYLLSPPVKWYIWDKKVRNKNLKLLQKVEHESWNIVVKEDRRDSG